MHLNAITYCIGCSNYLIYLTDGVVSEDDFGLHRNGVGEFLPVTGNILYIYTNVFVAGALVLWKPECHSTVTETCFDG